MWLPDFARLCVLVLRFPDPSWPSFAVLNLLGPKFARCLPLRLQRERFEPLAISVRS